MTTPTPGETNFLSTVLAWMEHPESKSNAGYEHTAEDLQVQWDATSGLLVARMAHAGRTGRIFLSSWEQGIRWATDWPGTLDIMPAHRDPGLPVLDACVDWAHPWRMRLPADVRQILERFACGRWALLHWASHSREALDLLRSAPTLLWILLMTAQRDGWPEEKIGECLRWKRRDILGACGLHPAEATLKLLAKFQAPHHGQQTFAWLVFWLGAVERVRKLRQFTVIHEAQLCFLTRHPELSESPLVRSAPDDPGYFRELTQWLTDMANMAAQLRADAVLPRIRQCKTPASLRRLHDRLVRQLNQQNNDPRENHAACQATAGDEPLRERASGPADLADSRYGPPPLPGNESIIPITRYQELALEGQQQEHCVRAYHERIMAGRYYVYRVLAPERCTLGLALFTGLPPRIDQLKGHRNHAVSLATQEAVHEWLKAGWHGLSAPAFTTEGSAPPDTWPDADKSAADQSAVVSVDSAAVLQKFAREECDLAIIVGELGTRDEIRLTQQIAKKSISRDVWTMVVAPQPWPFEGLEKQAIARQGRAELEQLVNTLITLPCDNHALSLGANWSPGNACAALNTALTHTVRSVTDTITQPGLIGVDFSDVRTILKDTGSARVGIGMGMGERRAHTATRQALASLMAECDLYWARGLLTCMTGGVDANITEIDQVATLIRDHLSESADVLISMVIEPAFQEGQLRVTIVAAGTTP